MGGIEREAATKKVASMIGRPHKVDLKNSDVHVMIEVMQVSHLENLMTEALG